jgi:hypothetical protein
MKQEQIDHRTTTTGIFVSPTPKLHINFEKKKKKKRRRRFKVDRNSYDGLAGPCHTSTAIEEGPGRNIDPKQRKIALRNHVLHLDATQPTNNKTLSWTCRAHT